MGALSQDLASGFARIALGHVERAYPNNPQHVLKGPEDLRTPQDYHPIFHGSFDWHSCVHGYWLLARLYRRFPDLPERAAIGALMDRRLTAAAVEGERAYFTAAPHFERPYGWAWLLALVAELRRHENAEGRRWRASLAPLDALIAGRLEAFLPGGQYPVRSGTHASSAFALTLAIDYAQACGAGALEGLLRQKARQWFGNDADCQAWEPGGEDFLSPALIEAVAMQRLLPAADFAAWFGRFLPRLDRREPATLFAPAVAGDRSDGKIAHLDGLNLSRAWCWRALAAALDASDPRRAIALDAAKAHLEASLPHVAGDYAGEHWLASFALLALEA
jgi:hypothetical protein